MKALAIQLPTVLRDGSWQCTIAATVLIAIVVGSRSAFGLFLSPINSATGLGLATIGFAAALGHLGQGLAQPLVGALADRHGASRVIAAGALGFAMTTVLFAGVADAAGLVALILLGALAGTAMGSIATMLGEVSKRVPVERQGMALGIVGAGGPAGQLLFGPLTQATIQAAGWTAALWLTAAIALLALPLALVFRNPATSGAAPAQPVDAAADSAAADSAAADSVAADSAAARRQATAPVADDGVGAALRRPAFWLIGIGFAACGFHMSFLTMHMPGFIERCGLPGGLAGLWLAILGVTNIAASLAVGLLAKHHAPAMLLTVVHVLRAVFVAGVLVLPPTAPVMLLFAIAMGMTYTAALAPTTMLVKQAFGGRRLGTLFGMVMLLHQLGSFAGVWLGGLMAESMAGYRVMWTADIGLALLAAALNLPLRPAAIRLATVPKLVVRTV